MPEITEVEEIQGLTKDLEDKSVPRINQYDEDEALWRLEKYVLADLSGVSEQRRLAYPTFTSNDPRNLADLLQGMLTRHAFVPRGDLYEPQTTEEEDELSVHERFASGLWREVDIVNADRGDLPHQVAKAWFMCLRGGVLVRYWVYKGKSEHPFDIEIWDPRDCVWLKGRRDLSFVCHHYRTDEYAVRDAWPKFGLEADGKERTLDTDPDGCIEIWDGWWKCPEGNVWNAVAIGNEWAKKPTNHTKERRIKKIPVQLTRSLGAPIGPKTEEKGRRSWLTDQWESIYGANREMYALYNRVVSLYILIVRQAGIGPWHHQLTSGSPVPKLEEAIGPLRVVQTKGKLGPIAPPPMAAEAKELFAAVQGHEQRGGAPYSAFGQTPFQMSGIALSQLQGAMELRTKRLSEAMATDYKAVTDGIIEQFIALKRNVKLEGVDRRERPFMVEFTAQKLKVAYHLEFDHRTDLPIHQMQEANIASTWASLGVSLVRIYDELLHIQDPNWEYRRKLQEMADQNPLLAALKLAKEFRRKSRIAAERGAEEEAVEYAQYAQIVMSQVQATQAQAQQQAGGATLPPPQAGSPEMFGQGGSFTPNPQNFSNESRLAGAGLVGPQG